MKFKILDVCVCKNRGSLAAKLVWNTCPTFQGTEEPWDEAGAFDTIISSSTQRLIKAVVRNAPQNRC